MSVQACVLTFSPRSGTGTQTVTGVVDKDGNNFVGKVFYVISGHVGLNTLGAQTFGNYASLSMGIDNGTIRGAQGFYDTSQFTTNKVCSVNSSSNSWLLDGGANAFLGGDVFRQAYISAVASGSFTINYVQNDRTGDACTVLILGGSDLTVDLVNASAASTTYATTGSPLGMICLSTNAFNNSGGVTTGSGGGNFGVAWDTKDSGRGISLNYMQTNAGNSRYQSASYSKATIDYATTTVSGTSTIDTWGASSFKTGSVGIGSVSVFSGANVRVAAGSFNQPTTNGQQVINLGINAAALILSSVGATTNALGDLSMATHTIGWGTPTTSTCMWNGESGSSGTALTGTRYLKTGAILQFATPNGASTTFHSTATIVSIDSGGNLTLDWSGVDGTAREIIWFAIGSEAVPHGTIEVVKVWPETQGQTRLRIGSTQNAYDYANVLTGSGGTAPLTTGAISLLAGTYYISEENSYLYDLSIVGTRNGTPFSIPADGSVTVSNGDVIVVTLTNADIPPPTRNSQWKLFRFDIKPRAEETS